MRTRHPMYTIVCARTGEEVGPRYGGARGYFNAEEWRKANDILLPHTEVVPAPPRLPRRGGR